MTKKRLLITGGLGYVGSWLTEYGLKKFDVTVLARKVKDVRIHGEFALILADLANESELRKKLSGREFDYVIHAGSSNDAFVEGYSSLSYQVNAFGTRSLLRSLNLDALDHFVYLSTYQIYGTYSGVIDENTKPKPRNDYGLSHLLAEYFLQMDIQEKKYSILRMTNLYGCPKELDSSKWWLVHNDLSKSAFYHKEIKLSGNGKAVRDFIWMGDAVEATLQLLEVPAQNETYNLSGEDTLSMYDIACKVQLAYQKHFGTLIPITVNNKDISLHDTSLFVPSTKLKNRLLLNYEDKFLEETMKIFKLLETQN